MTRREVLKAGAAATLLGATVGLAGQRRARAMSMSAATTASITDFPYNCRGDGSDEREKIQKCINENLFVEIPEPPAGVGYGIDTRIPIRLRNGVEIGGVGDASKFLRLGRDLTREGSMSVMVGDSPETGNTGIRLNGFLIDGDRHNPNLIKPATDRELRGVGIGFGALFPSAVNSDIKITGVSVMRWPGVGIRTLNVREIEFNDVLVNDPARGGIINTRESTGIRMIRTRAFGTGDDAFAFNCVEEIASPVHGLTQEIYMSRCSSSVRSGAQYGAALKFFGAQNARVENSIFKNAKNANVYITTAVSKHGSTGRTYNPAGIEMDNCRMYNGSRVSYQVIAKDAQRIVLTNSLVENPGSSCFNVTSLDGQRHRFDVRATGNTFKNPKTAHTYVDPKISGVVLKNNTLL